MTTETAVDAIERSLLLDILRGRYASGSRLPTVRELAAAHQVTPATIQRVVARLETRGLVSARQGSGLVVHDPRTAGDAGLVPHWLAAFRHEPAVAAAILRDFLELRRVVAARLLTRHRAELTAQAAELARAAAAVGAIAPHDLDAIREADLGFAKALVALTGNIPAATILNTLGRVLTELPEVAHAMYARPKENARAMTDALAALAKGGPKLEERLDAILLAVDDRTVSRFARALTKDLAS